MKTKNLTLIFILSGALLSLLAAHGAAFINGSFELPGGLPPNSYLHLSPGDTGLVGWSIEGSGGFIAYINGMSLPDTDFNPVDGDYHLSFNGGDQAPGIFLSQSFDTIVGQQLCMSAAMLLLALEPLCGGIAELGLGGKRELDEN